MAYYYNYRDQTERFSYHPTYSKPNNPFLDQPMEAHRAYLPPRPMQAQPSPGYLPEPPLEDPLRAILPSSFPPGTDRRIVEVFNRIDRNGDGLIDDVELQAALSTWQSRFELRTVHLLIYLFTNSCSKMIGPREFIPLYKSLQNWKTVFERADRDHSGRINATELRSALYTIGYPVPFAVVNLLISKFDNTGRKCSISYDNFIECCLTIKGLSDKFKAKEDPHSGCATFTSNDFLVCVIPFIIA